MGHIRVEPEVILYLLFFLPNLSFYFGLTDQLLSNLAKFLVSVCFIKRARLTLSPKGFLMGFLSCLAVFTPEVNLFLIPVVLLASFSEELVFRAVLQGKYGVLPSSLLFVLWHVPKLLSEPPYVLLSVFTLSLFWGLIYERTGDFSLVFSSHFFYDLFLSSGGSGPLWLSVVLVFVYVFRFW